MSLSTTKIIAQYDAYFNGLLGPSDLHDDVFTNSDIKTLFNTRPTELTRIEGNVLKTMTDVLQPFYPKFSPKGIMDFTPNPFNLDHVKINNLVTPDDLAGTALDFLSARGVDKSNAPILVAIAQYLIMKAKENDEELVAFKGVYKKPTTADQIARIPGAVVDSRDGIRQIIRNYNTAGLFAAFNSTIAMGAVPTDPALFVTYVETLYYSIDEKYRSSLKWLAMSESLRTRFARGMRIKYNTQYAQATDFMSVIDTPIEIKGFRAMNGSDMIWSSPPENCVGWIKGISKKEAFAIEVDDIYDVQMGTDWWETYNFIDPRMIWNNGQDLAA